MLCTCEPDSFGAEIAGNLRVVRCIRIGPHLHLADLIGPVHNRLEVTGHLSVNRRDAAFVNKPRGAVQRDEIVRAVHFSIDGQRFVFLTDQGLRTARYTAFAHTARHNRRVGRHAAARGQNAFGGRHALNVLRGGLFADQDHRAPHLLGFGGLLRGKGDLPGRRARGCRETLCHMFCSR